MRISSNMWKVLVLFMYIVGGLFVGDIVVFVVVDIFINFRILSL